MESCSEINNRQTIRFPPIKMRDLSVEFHSETNNRQTIRFSPIKIQDLPVEFRSETNNTISPYKIRDLLVNSVRKPAIVKECDVSFIK